MGRAAKVWTQGRAGSPEGAKRLWKDVGDAKSPLWKGAVGSTQPLWKGLGVEVAGLAPAGDVAGQPCPCTVHPKLCYEAV
jgi:hypothetical protein